MAGGIDLGTGPAHGRKPLDTAINLVPFIDLMAVTISFLLMTAVWNATARFDTRMRGDGSEPGVPPAHRVALLVASDGLTLDVDGTSRRLPRGAAGYPFCAIGKPLQDCAGSTLSGALRDAREQVPGVSAIEVRVEDSVRYDDVVRVLDACNATDATGRPALYPDVSISPVQ